MKKIIIFGGSGFLGRNVLESINKNKFEVISANSNQCNLEDLDSVKRIINSEKPNIIINFAFKGVGSRQAFDFAYLQKNLLMSSNVLLAAIDKNIEKIIQIGSSNEYGDSKDKINEDHILNPKTIYGTSKAVCSLSSLEIARSFNLPLIIIRPFNVYGPFDNKSVIYNLILTLLTGKTPSLTKGEQFRDYLYSVDFANIFSELLNNLNKLKNGEIYNLASGEGVYLNEIFNLVFKLLEKESKFESIPYNENEYFSQIADVNKLRKIIKIEKSVSLEKGLSHTINWVRSNH